MPVANHNRPTVQEANSVQTDTKCHFEKLSPIDDADISIYEEAINFAFSCPDIKNIAISGAYGSGKSSVLATYKKKHPEKKFIHISLAHFISDTKTVDSDNTKSNPFQPIQAILSTNSSDESVLEGKILNQLIHQIEDQNIPQTKFRIKNSLSNKQVRNYSIEIIVFFLSLMHLVLSHTWIDFVSTFPENSILRSILSLSTTPLSFFISGCIGLVILSFYVYASVKKQRFKATIRKLSLQGNDIELFENSTDSFFDKYLNEVLYLFENAGVDGIVFEDMDRYELEGIFERLREVNTLANIRLSNKGKPMIRFVFLLRDDLFVSKDRTKFFDYIIPVVPVVDSSNSYDQLIGYMEKNGFRSRFTEGFLQGLSLYIDDMRLLKNICNEFVIYYSRLGSTELDPNKMLAIIAYKNIFPRDFSQLQMNQGFVFSLFASKVDIIKKRTESLQQEIDEIDVSVQAAEKEHLISLREVDAVYVDRYCSGYDLRSHDDQYRTDWLTRHLGGDVRKEYTARRENLTNKISIGIQEWEKQKGILEQKILKLNQLKLSELVSRDNIDEVFSISSKNALGEINDYQDVKRNQYFNLLKYLIRNGYIDESYADYMTYFYPNSLTTVDKVFLQSVANKAAKDFYYELKKPDLVLAKLNLRDFDEEETLNFSLLTYMLTEPKAWEALKRLINQIHLGKRFDFVSQYLYTAKAKAEFVRCLNTLWPDFFASVLESHAIPERQIWMYSHEILEYCSRDNINASNIENCLTDFIASQPDYLKDESVDISALAQGLILLNVKFKEIDFPDVNERLFVQVYRNSLYALNFKNICTMLSYDYGIDDTEEVRHRSYSYIIEKCTTPLYRYVQDEIKAYMEAMLDFCGKYITDSEPAALDLLNNSNIPDEQKQHYIEKLASKLSLLNDVKEFSLWPALLQKECVKFSEKNVIDYWLHAKSFDCVLVNYINNGKENVRLNSLDNNDKLRTQIFNQIIQCADLKDERYIGMLVSLNQSYENGFSVLNIPSKKMKLLIDYGILHMTEKVLKDIRANYPDVQYYFIQKNLDVYLDIMTTSLILQEEVLEILSWNLPDEKKLALLQLTDEPVSIVGKGYTLRVTMYILENLLDLEDIPSLYQDFQELPLEIQEFIVHYAENHIDSIIGGEIQASDQLELKLLASNHLDEDEKTGLILTMIPEVSKEKCKKCFEIAGRAEFAKIFEKYAKPKILKAGLNKAILDALVSRGWLYDYHDNQHDGDYYSVRRNEPNKKS